MSTTGRPLNQVVKDFKFKSKMCPINNDRICVGSFCKLYSVDLAVCSLTSGLAIVKTLCSIDNHLTKLNSLIDSLVSEIKSGFRGEA